MHPREFEPAKKVPVVRTSLRRMIAVTALLLIAIVGAAPTLAQTTGRSVTWQNYDVDLAIRPDASVAVTETQTIAFSGTFQ